MQKVRVLFVNKNASCCRTIKYIFRKYTERFRFEFQSINTSSSSFNRVGTRIHLGQRACDRDVTTNWPLQYVTYMYICRTAVRDGLI